MKLICCDKCEAVVALGLTGRSCDCGNIYGRYIGRARAVVVIRESGTARVVGFPNGVRAGLVKEWRCWVMEPGLTLMVVLADKRTGAGLWKVEPQPGEVESFEKLLAVVKRERVLSAIEEAYRG